MPSKKDVWFPSMKGNWNKGVYFPHLREKPFYSWEEKYKYMKENNLAEGMPANKDNKSDKIDGNKFSKDVEKSKKVLKKAGLWNRPDLTEAEKRRRLEKYRKDIVNEVRSKS